jgi:hypothetical protein
MILVINKLAENSEKYKIFYKREDIDNSILLSEDFEILEIEPTIKVSPIKDFVSYYGC